MSSVGLIGLEQERHHLSDRRVDQLVADSKDFVAVTGMSDAPLVVSGPSANPETTLAQVLARAKVNQHHRITKDELSVREYMGIILRRLDGLPL